jgi:ferredoxin-NADP reductase/Na+-translocating ferredoxin:NAD+ oxidoreductase RnfD subunit
MYRLALYYLIVLVGIAVALSFLGFLQYNPLDILIESFVAVITCYIANKVFATVFGAVTNTESVLITALILTLIVPVKFPHNLPFFIVVSGIAMAAKYFPTIDKRHMFNPAAAGIAAIALLSPEHVATWWVGTPIMMPFVLIGGLLLVRRIRREQLVTTFFVVYFVMVTVFSIVHSGSFATLLQTWQISIFSSSLLFFGFVMLTEPLTSPATETMQSWYAILVAVLYATPQIRLGLILTPELALLVGNVFSYMVSPKYRLVLKLQEKIQAAKDTYVFNFGKVTNFAFAPGQYMEWTLPHKGVDSRGNRRYFSLASAPSENVQVMVRFYDPPSSYKKTLLAMKPGDSIVATSLEGSFVLPEGLSKKIVLVAGGVGVAPFKSMIENLIATNQKADIVLLYANRHVEEIAFWQLFDKAQANGVRTVYTLTDTEHIPANWLGESGYFTSEKIQKYVPDFQERIFYISGPQPMVQQLEGTLRGMGLPHSQLKTDYFPGYVA